MKLVLSLSTECIVEALEICITNNNSGFVGQNLIQTNGTATGLTNSCSYSYLAIPPMDNAANDAEKIIFQEIFYFARYRDDCKTVWTNNVGKINLLLEFLKPLDENLKLAIEIGGKSLSFLELKITIDQAYMIDLANCTKPGNKEVGSTASSRSSFSNYKSHMKKK